MKFSFLSAFILSAFSVFSQVPTGLPMTNSKGWIKYGYLQSDSGSIPARRDTNFTARYPTIVYWENSAGSDTSFWVSNGRTSGRKWVRYGAGWSLTGNAGTDPSTNFLGTTDNQSLSFRVNNTQFMRLHNTGNNISIGEGAMLPTQTGINGVAIGYQALNANTSGNGNIGIGYQALLSNTVRKGHVAIGWQAGQLNTVGEHHTYVGTHAGQFVNAGNENVGIGSYSLEYSNNTEAGENTAVGTYSRFFGGNRTTAVGYRSGWTASFPSPSTKPSLYSTSIGYHSLYTIENDTSVTALGDFTLGANGIKNATALGSRAYVGASNSMVLGSINGVNGATANTNVGIGTTTPAAQLHTTGSVRFAGLASQSNATDSVVVANASNGALGYRAISSIVGAVTASNGLTKTVNDIALGGTLTQNTTINADEKRFTIGRGNISFTENAKSVNLYSNDSTVLGSVGVVYLASGKRYETADSTYVYSGSDYRLIALGGPSPVIKATPDGLQLNSLTAGVADTVRINSSNLVLNLPSNGSGKVLTSDADGIATWQTPATPTNYWTLSGSILYNNSGTNVGIGTSTPISKLQVDGSVRLSDTLLLNDGGYGPTYKAMLYKVDAPTIRLNGVYTEISSDHPGGNVRLFTNGGFGIMTSGGQFSLGSYAPTTNAKLHVEGAAQVTTVLGIGSSTAPVASAQVEVTSTTKGFLPPRMTTTQRDAISSPAEGLVIYNLTTHKLNVYTTTWETVTSL